MKNEIELNKPIKHIAFIMDGNGRWAKKRGLPRHLGHKEACKHIREIVRCCVDQGVYVVSLYAFSTENWKRPQDEIEHLFDYLDEFFNREIDNLMSDGVRVIISGDISKLPKHTQETCLDAIERSKNNKVSVLNICLNYGGRQEIIRATKEIAEMVKTNKIDVNDIDLEMFEDHLYTKGLPNVDLLIRTSGEMRTSNFLPWQLAYAEFIFVPVYWPDFNKKVLIDCFKEFNNRNRRFGGLGE